MKTLSNTDVKGAKEQVKDLEVWGNGDMFKLISKASSNNEGWMKSTKAMEIEGLGCVVQVTTQQQVIIDIDGVVSHAVAEALTWVPGVTILEEWDKATKKCIGRRLVPISTIFNLVPKQENKE